MNISQNVSQFFKDQYEESRDEDDDSQPKDLNTINPVVVHNPKTKSFIKQ